MGQSSSRAARRYARPDPAGHCGVAGEVDACNLRAMTQFVSHSAQDSTDQRRLPVLAILFIVIAFIGVSCSSTRTVGFPNEEAVAATPIRSVVTVMVEDRSYLRAAVENHMTGRLKDHGVEAYSSHPKVSLKGLEGNKEKARQALSIWGADAVLVSRLTDRTDLAEAPQFVSDASHWERAWAAPANRTQFESSPWGGEIKVTIHVESKLYRLSDAELLWVGYTETELKEFTDDMKRIRSVSRQIVDRLVKDGVIQ